MRCLTFFISLVFLFCLAIGKEQHFQFQDRIPFYVNKIGPYSNPSETYAYYSLPFCQPSTKDIQHKHQSFAEILEGNVLQSSLYDIQFGVDSQWQQICSAELNREQIEQFKSAIDEYYFFEMYLDNLPLRGFIGTVDRSSGTSRPRYYLFKHLHFEVLYNKDQVIFANVTSDLRQIQELGDESNLPIVFSYSVRWSPTNVDYSKRLDFFKDSFFSQEMEIHWLSIINSFVLVILLTGFIAIIILRVLKSDITRYSQSDPTIDEQEDYGWKLIHGDVFRFPPYPSIFSALLGVGAQFLLMSFFILVLAFFGRANPGLGGSLYGVAVVVYALTCVFAGLVSSYFYKQFNGESWAWNIVLTTSLYAVPFFFISSGVNTVASIFNTTSYIPLPTVILVIVLWALVGFPLTVFGGIAGKRLAPPFNAPCRTKNFPRAIPPTPWYRQAGVQMLMAGFLPFSAIYIELYYVYTSIWGHNSYTLFGILMIVFFLLIIVTACITIALTYFQLSMEDHRWWWRSFLSGGSTGLFIYAYSFFYYYYRSKMTGLLQASFYFGYMFVLCYYFFLMLGFVGFYSSLVFIRHIYETLKCE
eukprot:TRINITY_DN7821_c0_g1_i1.p1 TRINITY_DN7821_c0_g1~~TRINITY_DN7821_c0_g1_i1.p1  ORF type:complete len:607 (-),score=70.80 TRINITY_DN7821_c0_g1_i1:75-1829(-)